MNKKLELFIPITKVDEENRLVYGIIACEEVDNSGEIFDYESSKPNFQAWSDAQYEASNGLSKGNVREMHTSSAAGKLTDISFNDDAKTIEGCAKVVDEGAWQKVLEGVYTGFSMGGRYAKRWNDNGTMRYTASPVEVSLVDKPCIKSALFEGMVKNAMCVLQKADGTTEERALNIDMSEVKKGHETQNRNDQGKWSGGHKHEATSHGGSDPTGHGEDEAAPTVKTGALGLAIDKSDKGDSTMYVPTNDEILPVAQNLAKAAGKTDADWLDFVQAATDQIVASHGGTVAKADDVVATETAEIVEDQASGAVTKAEHSDEGCTVENCDKCADKAAKADTGETAPGAEGVAKAAGPDEGDHSGEGDSEPAVVAEKADAPELQQGWQAKDGTFFAKKADAVAHNEKLAKGDAPPSLAEMLDGALAIAKGDVVVPEAAATETTTEEAPLGKSIDVQLNELADFINGPDLRKGMYQLSYFTEVLRSAAYVYTAARNEAASEGDSSGVPATVLEGIEKLGQALIDMATEEVGEMLTELREAGASEDCYIYPDCCYLAAGTMGLEKADADAFFAKAVGMVKADEGRLAKRDLGQPVENELSKAVKAAGYETADAFVAGIADLQKKAGELAEIAPKVEELTKFITDLKSKPMPKAATTGVAVEKSIDAGGSGGTTVSGDTPLAKAEAALAGLSGPEIAQLAIKMSHASGGVKLSLNP